MMPPWVGREQSESPDLNRLDTLGAIAMHCAKHAHAYTNETEHPAAHQSQIEGDWEHASERERQFYREWAAMYLSVSMRSMGRQLSRALRTPSIERIINSMMRDIKHEIEQYR